MFAFLTCCIQAIKFPALYYRLQIFGQKIEKFPFLVHKLSVKLTALQNKNMAYNGVNKVIRIQEVEPHPSQ